MKKRLFVCVLVLITLPVLGQEDAYTCIDKHPNGVEVWGCFEGEPYWHIAAFAGERPMISGGTLYMPSKEQKPLGMGGRIVDNAITTTKWQVEGEVNRKVEERIYEIMDKVF